jgi:hypothetical protein
VIKVAQKVMTAQRDICEAQHHILLAVAGEALSPIAVAVIRLRLLSAIEHLASAAQEAERGHEAQGAA